MNPDKLRMEAEDRDRGERESGSMFLLPDSEIDLSFSLWIRKVTAFFFLSFFSLCACERKTNFSSETKILLDNIKCPHCQ